MRLGSLKVATMDGTGQWGYMVDLDNPDEIEQVKRTIERDRARGAFRAVPGELKFTEEPYSPELAELEKRYYLATREGA